MSKSEQVLSLDPPNELRFKGKVHRLKMPIPFENWHAILKSIINKKWTSRT